MAYNVNTFLKPLSLSDKLVQVVDSNGVIKFTINPFSVKNTFVRGNIIYISLNSDREILLDFRNQTESRQALTLLESQLENLRNKAPNYIDRIIEEYIQGIGLSYSNGDLFISSNLIPAISGTYTIGNSQNEWRDLFVSTSSIYIGGITLSSDGTSFLMNSINLGTNDSPMILSYDGVDLLVNGTQSNLVGTISYNLLSDKPFVRDDDSRLVVSEDIIIDSEFFFSGKNIINWINYTASVSQDNPLIRVWSDNPLMPASPSNTEIAQFSFRYEDYNQSSILLKSFNTSDAHEYKFYNGNFFINGIDYLSIGGTLSKSFQLNVNDYDYIINGFDNLILSGSVFDLVSDFFSIDSTGSGQILVENDLTILSGGNLSIVGSSSTVTTSSGFGMVYSEDYSNNFIDNSLISKKYVENLILNLPSGNTGSQGPEGPEGSQGPMGPQGPQGSSGVGYSPRFIRASLPNYVGTLSPVRFQLSIPWPFDYSNEISIENEFIYINSSDSNKFYSVVLSFQIYNSANETYAYSLNYNTGNGTFSLFSTSLNGFSDANKVQTLSDIVRVPSGVTASFYFERQTTQTDDENILGSINIVEII